jgi:hypothetical protein
MAETVTMAAYAKARGVNLRSLQSRLRKWRSAHVGKAPTMTAAWLDAHIMATPLPKHAAAIPASATDTAPSEERVSIEDTGQQQTITCVSRRIKTVEEALDRAAVDKAIWQVERFLVNSWEGFVKDADGQPQTVPLWQVKVWLKRRVSRAEELASDALTARMAAHAPEYPRRKYRVPDDPHLLEISIFDHHFGKLAWARETGENYDLAIAESLYERAMDDLLRKASPFPVEAILLPIGNDFMHIDTLIQTTTGGTFQDADGRLAKIIECGQMALVRAIDRLLSIAPVTVLLVPGNHDQVSAWHTARFLWAWYRQCAAVTVEHEPRARKYHEYGINLIGFTHGNEEKASSLPAIMATESSAAWARTHWHEWHLGHYHRQRETQHASVDTFDGVTVRTLPSLSGRDSWHYRKGYLGTRLAEAFLWSKIAGPTGYFCTSAQEG